MRDCHTKGRRLVIRLVKDYMLGVVVVRNKSDKGSVDICGSGKICSQCYNCAAMRAARGARPPAPALGGAVVLPDYQFEAPPASDADAAEAAPEKECKRVRKEAEEEYVEYVVHDTKDVVSEGGGDVARKEEMSVSDTKEVVHLLEEELAEAQDSAAYALDRLRDVKASAERCRLRRRAAASDPAPASSFF